MKTVNLFDINFVGAESACLYLPSGVDWKKNSSEYDIGLYTDSLCFSSQLNESKINCAWIVEPPIINSENYENAIKNHKKFKYVFSYLRSLESKIDNFIFAPFGTSHIRESDINLHEKSKLTSMIFSCKQWNRYHILRHDVFKLFKNKNIDFYGSGTGERLQYKISGLQDYMFSIVIENSEEEDYFSEKLLDCFLTGTVPIYLGCPGIDKYFNSNGILKFKNLEELESILNTITPELYISLHNAVKENFEITKNFIHPEQNIQKWLQTL